MHIRQLGCESPETMFLVTLSFLFTTPGVLDPQNPAGGFLIKDLILLGAALYTAGEALHAAQ